MSLGSKSLSPSSLLTRMWKDSQTEESAESKCFILLSQERARARFQDIPALRGRGCEFLSGNGVVAGQDVPVGKQSVIFGCRVQCSVFVAWYFLFPKFPEPLHLQGASSNFLVLRIKVHKVIWFSHALWGPANSGKEGLKRGLLSYYSPHIKRAKGRGVDLFPLLARGILPHIWNFFLQDLSFLSLNLFMQSFIFISRWLMHVYFVLWVAIQCQLWPLSFSRSTVVSL